jgi:RNA polymerase sigma-70 factor (ECF subfamily)
VDARRAAEEVARTSYGRLVAYLAARSRDMAAAEDALAEAFARALETWPTRGVPDRPEAWLLTVARRGLVQEARHADVHERATPTLRLLADEAAHLDPASDIPDERLGLLFACAHPAVDARMHAPLMLQAVLGLDAERIASAFLVAPATMGQRLVRTKQKIKAAGVPFAIPPTKDLTPRLAAVLDAVYAAYGTGWDDVAGFDSRNRGLTTESVRLAEVVVELAPDEPEARGLLALMLHAEARRRARRTDDGAFVPLADQDTTRWDRALIVRADEHLVGAARAGMIGRYQLEASIQSVHNARATSARTDWLAVSRLYDGLVALAPSTGALVARSAARLEALGPVDALAQLDALDAGAVREYQPYWVVRSEALRRLGDPDATAAFDRAVGLTSDPALRAHLVQQAGQVTAVGSDDPQDERG